MKQLFILLTLIGFASCKDNSIKETKSLIPFPVESEVAVEYSDISNINFEKTNDLVQFGPWLSSWKNTIYSMGPKNNAYVKINEDLEKGGYSLDISNDQIDISYHTPEGLKNALSSLFQYWELYDQRLPITSVKDNRAFQYRGMHLDVARHMYDANDIKKYIDFLAFYKYNYFHWHLTEDQGWRIEIKQYHKLQEIAAYRNETLIGHYNDQPHQFDGKKYGGYYTQEEVKDIVNYASARGIVVIPEIDIPGHSQALLSAYPELGCEDKEYKAATKWGVFSDILCPKEETFTFLENVFDEVIELFPSKYIHIGGDECPKDAWKKSQFCQQLIKKEDLKDEHGLQSYFIQRVEKYINSKGKSIIGWDEILEGGLAPNATVMSWRGISGGIEAANADHDVIMTPTSHCYFDYYQSDHSDEPLAIGGLLTVEKVYNWEIIPSDLPKDKHKYILGGQGNLWTEYIPTFDKLEYMSLTRMATLSEVLWGQNSKNLDDFGIALASHISYWKSKDVNVANHLFNPSLKAVSTVDGSIQLVVDNLLSGTKNFIKSPTSGEYVEMTTPFFLDESGEYSVQSTFGDQKGRPASLTYTSHLGNIAKIRLANNPSDTYNGSGNDCIINGINGSDEKYGGTEWLGFDGGNLDATLSFDNETNISSITTKTFKGEGQWIYLPKSIKVYNINNGEEVLIKEVSDINTDSKIARTDISFETIKTKNLRVVIENYGKIPEGKQGGGHDSWLFVDELIIK